MSNTGRRGIATNSGKRFEQRFAQSAGGKRTPRSGAVGGGDVSFAPGELWRDFSWELKHRASLPKLIVGAMDQAESDLAIGDRRRPAVALEEEGGRTLVCFRWMDLAPWVEALNEVGNASRLKSIVRQIDRDLTELKGAIR